MRVARELATTRGDAPGEFLSGAAIAQMARLAEERRTQTVQLASELMR